MNSILYEDRCKCKELFFSAKKPKPRGTVRPANYPIIYTDSTSSEIKMKTFQIFYDQELSLEAKLILGRIRKKYVYYALDDISYAFNLSLSERKSVLELLYSIILSLHNTDSIDFFNIWVENLSINKNLKTNRFLNNKCSSSYEIVIKVLYKTKKLPDVRESLW